MLEECIFWWVSHSFGIFRGNQRIIQLFIHWFFLSLLSSLHCLSLTENPATKEPEVTTLQGNNTILTLPLTKYYLFVYIFISVDGTAVADAHHMSEKWWLWWALFRSKAFILGTIPAFAWQVYGKVNNLLDDQLEPNLNLHCFSSSSSKSAIMFITTVPGVRYKYIRISWLSIIYINVCVCHQLMLDFSHLTYGLFDRHATVDADKNYHYLWSVI